MEERQLLFWTIYFLTYLQMSQHNIKSSHLALIPQKHNQMLCLVRDGLKFFLCSLSLVPTVQSYSLSEGNLHGWNAKNSRIIFESQGWVMITELSDFSVTLYQFLWNSTKKTLNFKFPVQCSYSLHPIHPIWGCPSYLGPPQSFSTIFGWFFFLGTGKAYFTLKSLHQ